MGNAASASYSVFSTIPYLSVARKTLIFQCFQKYLHLTSAFDRPGFQRMIADIEKGRINLVITKDLSRLGRNYIMCGRYTDV
ncbi:MAG: recombinase family protein [Acutalibacter sp.]|nr:recombinase family protein [Acutalibacter sp.]